VPLAGFYLQVAPSQQLPGDNPLSRRYWAPGHVLALVQLFQELQADMDQLVVEERRGDLNPGAHDVKVKKASDLMNCHHHHHHYTACAAKATVLQRDQTCKVI
jgi:hypothetical protein